LAKYAVEDETFKICVLFQVHQTDRPAATMKVRLVENYEMCE
jgi:hypothetical protein